MRNDKENLIVNLTLKFSLNINEYSERIRDIKKFEMASQIFRNGTSIGANIREAQNAESKADFIHKIKIAAKELEETKYWLIICERSESYPFQAILKEKINELGLIVYKILSTSKK
jgi:four helix bundle protein